MTRSIVAIAAALGLATVGAWLATGIQLDTGLEALLPADSVSVVSIEEAREKLAIDEPLTVLVDSNDPNETRLLVDELASAFSDWPETTWVMTRYGLGELTERALYYVDAKTLEEWAELADEALDWEVCELSPLCVTIADPPELPGGDDIREAIDGSPAGIVLRELTGHSAREANGKRGSTGEEDSRTLCNDDGTTCAVQVMLSGSPGDLEFARSMKNRTEQLAREIERSRYPDARIEVIGRYRVAPTEDEIIVEDLKLVSVLAAVGALLVVLAFFRDVTAVIQLMVPMLSGLAVALGLIVLIEPDINIISASALAILAGMAIDFGIHLLMHYQSARAGGVGARAAARGSVRDLWVALLVAGVTTACGFAALSLTDFRGFSQMGWMASLGIIVTLLWTMAVFPPLVTLLPGRNEPRQPREAKPRGNRVLAWILLVLGIASTPLAARVGFESNLAKLQPEGVAHGLDDSMMRARRNINALYVGESEEAIDAALRDELMTTGARELLGVEPVVVSAQVILPPDADQKTATLERLRQTLKRAREKGIERNDDELLAELDELEPWVEVNGPPKREHIPTWLAATLIQKDGSLGKSGIIYVPLRGSNAEAMERLAVWLDLLREAHPDVTFASAAALLGEVTPALVSDAPTIVALVFLGLILATAVASRSALVTRDVFLATALSTVFFGATLAALGIDLHLYNLLAVPVVIGLAVDGAVHVRWAQGSQTPREQHATHKAVAASTLTSMVAFGALLTARSPGLRALGEVGVIGLGISLAVNLYWLRAWCASRE